MRSCKQKILFCSVFLLFISGKRLKDVYSKEGDEIQSSEIKPVENGQNTKIKEEMDVKQKQKQQNKVQQPSVPDNEKYEKCLLQRTTLLKELRFLNRTARNCELIF
ncbi:uncharacterized protein LOC111715195 [Eurytemora carolleeae]|uniref:uncharacterized protein LOC111715195 n=1 Tax=Eurytemora carolleeae TaxID=1294199 RepID=UPI000C7595AA|nr:uncharacterized protein LOC111715195 [Eurytemora carolleeae]|eukprot:XP_023346248.1 uncharacterized protein LOC111715195 [Eurytemora affinis]